jgi:hypothetical protein
MKVQLYFKWKVVNISIVEYFAQLASWNLVIGSLLTNKFKTPEVCVKS